MGFLSEILGGKDESHPAMDKKTVEKALKEALWPLLKQHGFQTFKGRTAWRHTEKRIDVVEIQFFPKEKADQWGITPYSFALPVGCFFTFVPYSLSASRVKTNGEILLPLEHQCGIRRAPNKTLKQRESKIPNIWYIDPKGKYLNAAVEDAKSLFDKEILLWFERFNDLKEVLRILLEDEEDMNNSGWGFGANHSPARYYFSGFVALELGEWSLAKKLLQQALGTSFLTPGIMKCMQSDRKFIDGATEAETAFNNELRAGIAKAEAALRGAP